MHRIPHNPNQRNFGEGGVKTARSGKLDAVNEKLSDIDLTLHPTKGFRRISIRRSRAQMIIAGIQNGERWPTRKMAAFLRDGA